MRQGSETFLKMLAAEAKAGGDVILIGLESAAELLWKGMRILKDKKFIARAEAEVERRTKGQPFRLDTPAGPLFLDLPLWRFAGRTGGEITGSRGARPTWDGRKKAKRGERQAAASAH